MLSKKDMEKIRIIANDEIIKHKKSETLSGNNTEEEDISLKKIFEETYDIDFTNRSRLIIDITRINGGYIVNNGINFLTDLGREIITNDKDLLRTVKRIIEREDED